MWLDEFKIALVQKNVSTIDKLLDEMPQFTEVDDAKEAAYLFQEAVDLLYSLQDETVASMKQIKQNINFLKSSLSDSSGKIDIKL